MSTSSHQENLHNLEPWTHFLLLSVAPTTKDYFKTSDTNILNSIINIFQVKYQVLWKMPIAGAAIKALSIAEKRSKSENSQKIRCQGSAKKMKIIFKSDGFLQNVLKYFWFFQKSKMAHFLGQFTTRYTWIGSKRHIPWWPAWKNKKYVHLRSLIFETSSHTF